MDEERGQRVFGAGDGELSSAQARKLPDEEPQTLDAVRRRRELRDATWPAAHRRPDMTDAAALCFALAIGVALCWYATC